MAPFDSRVFRKPLKYILLGEDHSHVRHRLAHRHALDIRMILLAVSVASRHYRSGRSALSVGALASLASALTPVAGVDRRDASAHLSPRVDTAARLIWRFVMRMLLKAVFDTDAANEVIGSGQGAEVNRRMVERLQPEAFYAFAEDGQRTVIMVFDLADPSQIPVLTENFYQQGKAKVTLTPCMNLEDLERGFEELASQMASMEG